MTPPVAPTPRSCTRRGRAHDAGERDRLLRRRNVEPETAELLGLLVRAKRAQNVLEIGTSNGYSTIWLGDAVEATGGSVVSLEIDAARTATAAGHLENVGLRAHGRPPHRGRRDGARGVRRRRLRPDLPRRRARRLRRLLARPRAHARARRPPGRRQRDLPRARPRRVPGDGRRRRPGHAGARPDRRGRPARRQAAGLIAPADVVQRAVERRSRAPARPARTGDAPRGCPEASSRRSGAPRARGRRRRASRPGACRGPGAAARRTPRTRSRRPRGRRGGGSSGRPRRRRPAPPGAPPRTRRGRGSRPP